jgi:hypothetical protein
MPCLCVAAAAEKRWTIFSSVWFLVKEAKFNSVPASLRYIWFIAWRAVMQRVYEAHKAVVLWRECAAAGRPPQPPRPGCSKAKPSVTL